MVDFNELRKEERGESTAASLTSAGSVSQILGRRREGEKKKAWVLEGR